MDEAGEVRRFSKAVGAVCSNVELCARPRLPQTAFPGSPGARHAAGARVLRCGT